MKIFKYLILPKHIAFMLTTAITLVHFTVIAQQKAETQHILLATQVAAFLKQRLESHQNNDFVDNISIAVNPIDERIVIPQCASPFDYNVDPATLHLSYINVRVNCASNSWYLFTNAKVSRTRTIVVTRSMISPSTVLNSTHLALAEVDVKQLRHTPFTELADVVGARLKYRVREGQPVQSNMLCYICKGDRVTISAKAGTMTVKTSGIAKQDGVIGDAIEVINATTQKSVVAQVASTQEVVVNL